MSDHARGLYVYRTLKEHAAKTQAPLIKLLQSRGQAVPQLLQLARQAGVVQGKPRVVFQYP